MNEPIVPPSGHAEDPPLLGGDLNADQFDHLNELVEKRCNQADARIKNLLARHGIEIASKDASTEVETP